MLHENEYKKLAKECGVEEWTWDIYLMSIASGRQWDINTDDIKALCIDCSALLYVAMLWVNPEKRKLGLATKFLEEQQKKYQTVGVIVSDLNEPMLKLIAKLGYKRKHMVSPSEWLYINHCEEKGHVE